jgi:GNAT superfamily N-acetyltransferase/SAM-dependent methyltransferase
MVLKAVARKLPEWARAPLRRMRDLVREVAYDGKGRFCPVCERSSRRFSPGGSTPRKDALCVHCGALERHRFLWLYVSRKTNLFDGKPKKMLHVSPELCFRSALQERLGDGYITADLVSPEAMVKMDITNISYPDQYFDVIYCSHVLEHVQDDRKAMSEFFRTLKNSGWAILLVPITADKTLEDPSILDPQERLRVFGQEDHVRRYGPDFVDRLRDAGFSVEVSEVNDLVLTEEAQRMGLTPASARIYYCTKQSTNGSHQGKLEFMSYTIRHASNADRDDIEKLVFGVLAEYGLKSDPGKTDADLSDIQGEYPDRGGVFDVLVGENGHIVGSVGLYRLDAATCEIRKMYLAAHVRGQGQGRRLLNHVIAKAKELGYSRIELETASVLKEAIALYERCGFRRFERDHLSSRCNAGYYLEL